MTGNSRRVEVRFLVTGRAPHRADAVTVVAALHRWLVRIAGSLRWPVAVRMAVQTARMSEHLSRFAEESGGARRRIADGSKFAGGPKREPLIGMHRGCDDDAEENGEEWRARRHIVRVPTDRSRAKGSRRTRCPVSWKNALATAGAIGGTPGSPTPVGASPDGTM